MLDGVSRGHVGNDADGGAVAMLGVEGGDELVDAGFLQAGLEGRGVGEVEGMGGEWTLASTSLMQTLWFSAARRRAIDSPLCCVNVGRVALIRAGIHATAGACHNCCSFSHGGASTESMSM